ncbi:DNA-binding NtrC family response regulator [Bartonella fuyuanensis]|uniref:DNA-binding transcriptional regulator NtrC n=1 Tax=Bartonella fuyuanensis TaxID=1460968 RepID=A0A840DU16_9HYPH|nr:sigma 54-interacting transcriptional regulator [Bartonella fuyuanensis]MBB4076470.1 DNA-binding NtrC family response regulator [Bartonella fuyuanensis]
MVGPILVASEDYGRRIELSTMLRGFGYRVIEAENGLRTIDLLHRRKNIVLALLDIVMSDLSVSDLIKMIRVAGVSVPIIVIAQHENQDLLQKALTAGAIDYWIQPVTLLRVRVTLDVLALISALEHEVRDIRRKKENHLRFSDLCIKSKVMQIVLEQSKEAAASSQNLLIEGEVGTGRETLARIIHHESLFSEGVFIRFQCSAIVDPEEEKQQWFKEFLPLVSSLEKGTLCLCDIDRLEPIQQKRFAHYLKERDTKGKISPFRIIAISTSHLKDLVKENFFLHSLFEQFSHLSVSVPALRELRDDFPEITQCLIDHIIAETGRSHVHGLAGSALSLLMQYDWPGNRNELEKFLFRAILLSEGPLLTVRDFPQLMGSSLMNAPNIIEGDMQEDNEQESIQFLNTDGHVRTFAEMEHDIIEKAVKHYKGHMSEIARRLHIGRSTLYRKMEELRAIRNQEWK